MQLAPFRSPRSAAALLAALLTAAAAPTAAAAQGVVLTPGTLVLQGRARAGEVGVGNPTDRVATFRVTEAFFLQNPDGTLRGASPRGPANSALPILRVGPRQFVLGPGASQTLRVALRPPPGLPPGEYRLHLSVANLSEQSAEPAEAAPRGQAGARGSGGTEVVIRLAVARAVRVLVRHQVEPRGGRIEGLTVQRRGAATALAFDVVREGETSLLASYQVIARGAGGRELRAWPERGAGVYAELPRRRIGAQVPTAEIPAGATLCVRLVPRDPGAPSLPTTESCAAPGAR